MHRRSIVIVTPALADANNGNWQTAQRWARLLRPAYRVHLAARWPEGDETTVEPAQAGGGPIPTGDAGRRPEGDAATTGARPAGDDVLLIALHARRSAASVAAWRKARPARPLVVVLTGTDLYRDIDADPDARRSLELADRLVVLNAHGARRLPPALAAKCEVVLQSCPARAPVAKPADHLRALMVGHLREEKDPRTYWRAVRRLAARPDLRFDHVGTALDAALGSEATALAAAQPRFRWLGGLGHAATRRRIQAAHVLVHASRMEGGAHVVIEAIRSGTPVIASRIDGNLGLLGDDYEATFEVGDDAALATLLAQARDDADMLPRLASQLARRASLFEPAAERRTLHALIDPLVDLPYVAVSTP